MAKTREELKQEEKEVLLTFLQQTKEGQYAKIEESYLAYSRMGEQREQFYEETDGDYYYSIR